jgi:hypothetical protein
VSHLWLPAPRQPLNKPYTARPRPIKIHKPVRASVSRLRDWSTRERNDYLAIDLRKVAISRPRSAATADRVHEAARSITAEFVPVYDRAPGVVRAWIQRPGAWSLTTPRRKLVAR